MIGYHVYDAGDQKVVINDGKDKVAIEVSGYLQALSCLFRMCIKEDDKYLATTSLATFTAFSMTFDSKVV